MSGEGEPIEGVYLTLEEARMARGVLADLENTEQTRRADSELSVLVRENRSGEVSAATARVASLALAAAAHKQRNNNSWSELKVMSDGISSRILRHNV